MSNTSRKTTFSISTLILELYGNHDYRTFKDFHSLGDAKRYYLKIIKSIKFSVEETLLVIDKNHKDDILSHIDIYQKYLSSSDSFDTLDQQMISFQAKLIFLLIGLMPARCTVDKVINKSNLWQLNHYRQIQYIQTPEQKVNLILKIIQNKYYERFSGWLNFRVNIYVKECNKNPHKLIEWLKINHNDIYLEIF